MTSGADDATMTSQICAENTKQMPHFCCSSLELPIQSVVTTTRKLWKLCLKTSLFQIYNLVISTTSCKWLSDQQLIAVITVPAQMSDAQSKLNRIK